MASKYTFSASKTNVNKDMPVFLTKFMVTFILPDALAQKYGAEVLVESINKVVGLDLDKMPEQVQQMYKGITRRFGGTVADTTVNLETNFSINISKEGKIYPHNLLRDWVRLIYNNEGVSLTKAEYSGSAVIEVHNVKGEIIRKVKVPIIYPQTNIPPMDLNYNEDAIYEFDMTWTAEDCKDSYID